PKVAGSIPARPIHNRGAREPAWLRRAERADGAVSAKACGPRCGPRKRRMIGADAPSSRRGARGRSCRCRRRRGADCACRPRRRAGLGAVQLGAQSQPLRARASKRTPMTAHSGAPAWRDRLGALLLSVCAAGAIVSAISAVDTVADAGSATEAVETWRLVGFVFFAGVFVLLALRPAQLRGLGE